MKTSIKRWLSGGLLLLLIIVSGSSAWATEKSSSGFDGTIILGRPTTTSMTASITTKTEADVYLAYGEKSGSYDFKTAITSASETVPAVLVMENLNPDKKYYYAVFYRIKGQTEFLKSSEYHFSMPKLPGNHFSFVIQSDSHLLNKADPALYAQNMTNMAALNPDFMMDLGDTFLMDNGKSDPALLSQEDVNSIYRQQLSYFSTVTANAPLFLTVGNHESQYGVLLDGTENNHAAKSTLAKTTYYPNPLPNEFYSGNTADEAGLGNPQNYYAYTWGDALFVCIDPYRYSENGASAEDQKVDGWGWTLGKTQYDWFRSTLENSNAKYKFVFAHHAIGNMRGGAEIARLYEWGGYDQKGNYLFDVKRPGWGKPIQQIMKDTGVTIFFQGHDHLFAREDVDGVVYQTIPKPAEKIADNQNNFKAYSGDVLLNSGFLNVSLTDKGVQVDYNRNYLVASGEQTTGVVYSYTVDEAHQVTVLKNTRDVLENYGKNETTGKTGKPNQSSNDGANLGAGAEAEDGLTPVAENGFSFAIEADPHFDENSSDALLNQTAQNILAADPKFLIDLGDTSMLEKLGKTAADAAVRNELVKNYFSQFGNLPVKMVTGNHDVKINNNKPNYYTFTQGNAQFIVLDPYAYSTQTVGKGGGWATTLGKEQYDWLKNTLATSQAEFKFVYIHNLTGGIGKDSRGGAEAAEFFEWGGLNEAGTDQFAQMRPGWEMPIHDLLVKYGVDVVFHGHDHFYAEQEKDGIIYQLVPQPGTSKNSVSDALAYGYQSGVILPSAGYVRVVVNENEAVVEYVKTAFDGSYSVPNVYRITE